MHLSDTEPKALKQFITILFFRQDHDAEPDNAEAYDV